MILSLQEMIDKNRNDLIEMYKKRFRINRKWRLQTCRQHKLFRTKWKRNIPICASFGKANQRTNTRDKEMNTEIDIQPKSTDKTDIADEVLKYAHRQIVQLNLDKEETKYIQNIIVGMAVVLNQKDKRSQLPEKRILKMIDDIVQDMYRVQLIDAVDNYNTNTTNKQKGYWV